MVSAEKSWWGKQVGGSVVDISKLSVTPAKPSLLIRMEMSDVGNKCLKSQTFELWCWRRLLRVPWTARRSNQSILKETSPGCSLEGLMLKLKLQYFDHLMQRVDSLEKTLLLEGIGGRRRGDNRG